MKPKITYSFKDNEWKCEGVSRRGFGITPVMAFEAWAYAIRFRSVNSKLQMFHA